MLRVPFSHAADVNRTNHGNPVKKTGCFSVITGNVHDENQGRMMSLPNYFPVHSGQHFSLETEDG